MVVSQSVIDRRRREADTIFTRIDTVEAAIERARTEDGDHWETGELTLPLETPTGEEIQVDIDIEASAAENAQRRYERAAELEAELQARREVAGDLAVLPSDPVAILVLAQLGENGPATTRTVAGAIDEDHDHVLSCCRDLATAEVLARTEAADEDVTRYRLADAGRECWEHLGTREGKAKLLALEEEMARMARRLWRGGPDYPTKTARDLGKQRDQVRTLYAAMRAVGIVEHYEGSIIKGSERKLSPKDETHKKHTYYVTTTVADRILREQA